MSKSKIDDLKDEVLAVVNDGARTHGEAVADGCCAFCGSLKMNRWDFKDALSIRDAKITQLCQLCQDGVYAEPEDDYEPV